MMLLHGAITLHGAISVFVISCSANIYKPFLIWRIWEMSNDGKHHFHLKEYSILQLLYAGNVPAYKSCWIEYSFRWKWTYMHTCSSFNEMGSKKKKTWNLKKKTFTQIIAVGRFLIFQKCIMTAKAMCLSINVAHNWTVFRLENRLQAYLVGLPEYCNTWKCFTYSFEAERQGEFFCFNFFYIENKPIDALVGSDARGDRKLLFFFLALCIVFCVCLFCRAYYIGQ